MLLKWRDIWHQPEAFLLALTVGRWCSWHRSGRAQNATQYPAVHRSASHYEELPDPNVNCAKDEKLWDGGNSISALDSKAGQNRARVRHWRKVRGWTKEGAQAEAPEWQGWNGAGPGWLAALESLDGGCPHGSDESPEVFKQDGPGLIYWRSYRLLSEKERQGGGTWEKSSETWQEEKLGENLVPVAADVLRERGPRYKHGLCINGNICSRSHWLVLLRKFSWLSFKRMPPNPYSTIPIVLSYKGKGESPFWINRNQLAKR